jgi:thiamine-phosphate pyrophosphorylase
VDTKLARGPIARIAHRIARAGADILQLRCRNVPDREQIKLATDMIRAVRDASPALVIVNNRADIAIEAGADGVHVGVRDLPVLACRRILGRKAIVGVTTHRAREAALAAREGADYLSYGPFYATALKPRLAPRGDSYLAAVKRLGLPFFAIGGIAPSNIKALRRKGIDRVAVCSAVLRAPDPAKVVRNLRRLLEM